MKVIVAGGRNTYLSATDKKYLLDLVHTGKITELVCGEAQGIDKDAKKVLQDYIPVKSFPALWDKLEVDPCEIKYTKQGKPYNRLAGSQRNRQMGEYAEGVILFDGGFGTMNMYKQAKELNLEIIEDFREILY